MNKSFRALLLAMLAAGSAFLTIGAGQPFLPGPLPPTPNACLTREVRITLASEQIAFCAPTSQPFHVVEDSHADPAVSYAGLDQGEGYGILNIRATLPGSAPGPGRPIYQRGEVEAYRQVVRELETSKADRKVSTGPEGSFWSETIPGVEVDTRLPGSAGERMVRSIEWNLEHDGCLWSFVISWDTEMQNAQEWEAASKSLVVQTADGKTQPDTAIDLGAVFLENPAERGISPRGAPVDVDTPSWWSGVCNDDNFYEAMGMHSSPLGAAWHGVPACGPFNSMHRVSFFDGAWGEYEFQCVELVMRFLYQEWGIAPWRGSGNTIKNSPPSSIVFYPNDGKHAIIPGDILTEDGSPSNSAGHAVIITAVNLDGAGSGSIRILEQNASSGGSRSLSVVKGVISPDAWTWGSPVQGVLHVKANQVTGGLKFFLPLIISQ